MWSPQNVESGLQAASLARLGLALLWPALHGQRGPGAVVHVFGLVLLAVLASLLDRCGPSWFQDHPLYVFRACGQAGLAQGLLALPSLATAIFVATHSWWWQQAARLFLASSFQVLLWYNWTASSASHPESSGTSRNVAVVSKDVGGQKTQIRTDSARPQPRGRKFQPNTTNAGSAEITRRASLLNPGASRLLFLTGAAAGCFVSAASALLHAAAPPPPTSPQLLLPGSVFELPRDVAASAWLLQGALLLATAPSLHHLAANLPRSFTPGEAGILAQALLALAAGSVSYLAGTLRQGLLHLLWSPHVVQLVEPDPGMHVPAFCMLVLFWVLLFAVCSTVALWKQRPQRSDCSLADSAATLAGAAVDPTPNGGATAAATAAGLRVRRATAASSFTASEAKTFEGEAVAVPTGAGVDGSKGVRGWLDRHGLPAGARAVGAGGASLSFFMLADLALWVLGRFVAASSRPRLATLAYWFACLAVAVPFMYAVSRASAARALEQQREKQAEPAAGGHATPWRQSTDAPAGLGAPFQEGWQEGVRRSNGAAGGNAKLVGNGEAATADAGDAHGCTACQECSGQGQAGAADGARAAGAGSATEDELDRGRPPGARQEQQEQQQPTGRRRRRRSALSAAVFHLLGVPHIVMRKGYHLLAIVLFLPAFGWDVRMLQASLAVAGAVLVFVEVLRCLGPTRLRSAIGGFMADFADSRDSGPLYVTHFTLLLGIAVPVWLGDSVCGAAAGAMMAGLYGSEAAEPMSNAATGGPPLSAAAARLLPSCRTVLGLSGLVSLGSGDTAAACVGFLLGRRRLFIRSGGGSRKTWEGTLSGAAAMLGSWAVVVWWMDVRWALTWGTWAALAAVTAAVALLEAVTQQLDNVVVPLYYLTHLVLTMTGN